MCDTAWLVIQTKLNRFTVSMYSAIAQQVRAVSIKLISRSTPATKNMFQVNFSEQSMHELNQLDTRSQMLLVEALARLNKSNWKTQMRNWAAFIVVVKPTTVFVRANFAFISSRMVRQSLLTTFYTRIRLLISFLDLSCRLRRSSCSNKRTLFGNTSIHCVTKMQMRNKAL